MKNKLDTIHSKDLIEDFSSDFAISLYEQRKKIEYSYLTFLCIGSHKIPGDSFGPMVGSKLSLLCKQYPFFPIKIYGTLEENMHYQNIQNFLLKKQSLLAKSCIIVIDAALSKKDCIGKIFVDNEKTVLGSSLGKNKLELGDISIKAVVGKDFKIPQYNFKTLQNVSFPTVIALSDIVANGIFEVIKYL